MGIRATRGVTRLSHLGIKVLPTYDPGAAMRQYTLRPIIIADFEKAKRQSAFPEYRVPERRIHIPETVGEILIGYIQGATNNIDESFDGKILNPENSLSSINNNQALVIQARALPFDPTDSVNLKFQTTESGNFSISLQQFDGVFAEGQNVYLQDNLMGIVHNLNEAAYNFSSESGIFDQRFTIVYQAQPWETGA